MLKIFLIFALSALFLVFPGCTGNDSPSVTDDIQNGVNNAVDETQNMADDLIDGTENMLTGDNNGTNDSAKMKGRMNDTNNSAALGNPSMNNMQ